MLFIALPLCAQTSVDQAVRQHERTIQEMERQRSLKPSVDVFLPESSVAAPQTADKAAGNCYAIREIILEGHPSEAGELPEVLLAEYRGRCLTAVDVNALLADLNRGYQSKGLVTTRAYAAEQNLSSGVLQLKIIVGKIEGFQINGIVVPAGADSRLAAAFPRGAGEILSLHDLEQGLENINRLPSQEGSFKIYPGQESGTSQVRLDLAQKPIWRVTEIGENTGPKTMGQWRSNTELALDNLLGRNDQFALGYNRNLQNGTLDGRFEGVTSNWLIPLGYHLFSLSGAYYDSRFTVPGVNQDYVQMDTRTQKIAANYEYLFHRSQADKESFISGLESSRQSASLSGYEIPSQKSQLTVYYAGVKGKLFEANRSYDWLLRWDKGLHALGAMDTLPGGLNPRFQSIKARLTATVPLGENVALWRSTVQLQTGDTDTPSQNQLFMGGRYDVRGFQDNSLFGYRGAYWRNDLEAKAFSLVGLKITPYLGLDGGQATGRTSQSLSQNHIAGYALGARLEWQVLKAEIAWAAALSRPREFDTDPKHYLYCSAAMAF
jgi:hemolysin activation/secretion protein